MMKRRALLSVATLVGVTAVTVDEVVPQDEDGRRSSESEKAAKVERDNESLIDTWVQHAMPGEHHRLLEKMAGQWTTAVKFRMNAEAPVVESAGTCTRKWILGKRFLLEEFDGGELGLPFQALAIYGYDAFEKKYTSVWVDTMNTAITTSQGTCQRQCETIAFTGRHGDPWTGTMKPSRGVTRFINENQHGLELYEPGPDGKEFKILEIVYTRKQPAE